MTFFTIKNTDNISSTDVTLIICEYDKYLLSQHHINIIILN